MKAFLARPQAQEQGSSGGWLTADKVLAEVKAGKITEATINDNVGRILRVIVLSGIMDHPHTPGGEVDTPAQQKVARDGADGRHRAPEESRQSLLPLDADKDSFDRSHRTQRASRAHRRRRQFAGAAQVLQSRRSQGIQKRAGAGVQVTSALGVGMEGEDPAHDTAEARANDLKAATDAAAKADVAVVVVGRYNKLESEGFDVKTMDLPAGQDELIAGRRKGKSAYNRRSQHRRPGNHDEVDRHDARAA